MEPVKTEPCPQCQAEPPHVLSEMYSYPPVDLFSPDPARKDQPWETLTLLLLCPQCGHRWERTTRRE